MQTDFIFKLRYGNTNTFFIMGAGGGLLVDTDMAGTLPLFYRAIKKYDIKISDISYVLATHYHPDHMGLISELTKMGVNLLLLDTQVPFIHFSDVIFKRDKRLNYEPINTENATVISTADSRKFLESIGIEGEIISVISHSEDSVALILDNGICFAGDLEPEEYLSAYGSNDKLKNDWEKVLKLNPKIIYYSHTKEKICLTENF